MTQPLPAGSDDRTPLRRARASGLRVLGALRYLRVGDWGTQVPTFWVAAAAYQTGLPRAESGFWQSVAAITVVLIAALAAGYLLNDFFDRAGDAKAKKKQIMSRAAATGRLVIGLCLLATAIGLTAVLMPGNTGLTIVAAWALAALGYSAPPIRLKERGVAGLATAALAQRLPPFLLLAIRFPGAPPAVVGIGAWLAAVGLVFIVEHQIEDFDSDGVAGVATWARSVGLRRALAIRQRSYAATPLVALLAGFALVLASGWNGLVGAVTILGITVGGLALLRVRYADNRRLPRGAPATWTRSTAPVPDGVRVYGAGLGGLVAAIKLADWGVPVELHDRLRVPGGLAAATCGVHAMMFDPSRLERYLDLSLGDCFVRVRREFVNWYGRTHRVHAPHWNCLRGGNGAALDRMLVDAAEARGVVIHWSSPLGTAPADGRPAIASLGHARSDYHLLGLPYQEFNGYWAAMPFDGDPLLFVHRSRDCDPDYGYLASAHGWVSALLFARGRPVRDGALASFERHLGEALGIRFPDWKRGRGAVGTSPRLEHDGLRVAGACAGILDPVFLSGVGQSMISGAVAALHVVDSRFGVDEFRRMTATWTMRRGLRRWVERPSITGLERLTALACGTLVPPVGWLPGRRWRQS